MRPQELRLAGGGNVVIQQVGSRADAAAERLEEGDTEIGCADQVTDDDKDVLFM